MRKSILVIVCIIAAILLAGCQECIIDDHGSGYPVTITRSTETELVAIRNQADLKGSAIFIIGFGGGDIRTEDSYSYYYYLPGGGIMRGKVPTTNAIIYEENRTDGLLITTINYNCYCDGNCYKKPWDPERYEFHVPVGTVVREFKLT